MTVISLQRFATLLTSVVLFGFSSAHAQDAAPNPYTDLSKYVISGNQVVPQQALTSVVSGGLSSSVTQIGQGNTASAALNGVGNVTTQSQVGANNASTLAISGAQNAVSTAQIGNSNTTSISVAGNGNLISNLQVGSGLSYQLQVIGQSAPISVQQFGRK